MRKAPERSLRRALSGLSSRRVERTVRDMSPLLCLQDGSAVAQVMGQLDQLQPERPGPQGLRGEDNQRLDEEGSVGAVQGPSRVHCD